MDFIIYKWNATPCESDWLTSIHKAIGQSDLAHAQQSSCCLDRGPNSTKQQEKFHHLGLLSNSC